MIRRNRWRALTASAVLVYLAAAGAAGPDVPPSADGGAGAVYLDPTRPAAERAADLVTRMTLGEKVSQMISSQALAIPRLGVREYGWWNEAIHGAAREQTVDGENPPNFTNTTSYPVSLSLASTWDPATMYRVASLISDEMREVVRENRLDLNIYSPTINLARDPRWGRNDETYGEDPLLTATMAAQYVDGMEGKDPQGRLLPEGGGYLKTSTTLKHYAANNSETDRLTGSSDMDERTLREYYTAQFRSVVRSSDPGSIMTAYNRVNGEPASASVHLLDALGRDTFGFQGFYTSDCDAVSVMTEQNPWTPPGHSVALDQVERGAWANAAGLDLNCNLGYHDTNNFATTLPDAVRRGVVTPGGPYTEADLDQSLVRLFTARIRLGEFDDPARVPWVTMARSRVPAGSWVNDASNRAVTQTPQRLAAARDAAAESIVLLRNAPVARPGGPPAPLLPLAVPAGGRYRLAVVGPACGVSGFTLGGYSSDQSAAGAAHDVTAADGLRRAVLARDPQATVDVLPGLADLSNPALDAGTLAAVAGYDAVVVCGATTPTTASEDHDREGLALPGAQAELIEQVAARNPRTVVALQTVGPVDVRGFQDRVPAMVWSSYGGQRTGEALADVLLGAVDPSGHLPFTWYADEHQLPALNDYRIRPSSDGSPGRTYQYFRGAVSYPFGHGLSYTTFATSAPRLSRSQASADDTVTVSVDVTDTGRAAGADVVQLYVSTPGSPAALERPRQRLAGFRKVSLQPGATAHVEIPVRLRDLAFWDAAAGRFVVDPGAWRFSVGSSSALDPATGATLTVSGRLTPAPVTVTAHPTLAGDAASAANAVSRLVYPVGAVIDPRLTVAAADDTLTGYGRPGDTGPGGVRPLPPDARVELTGDRSSVVTVDGEVIRARGPGVATVTATVRSDGGAASTRFVVVVQ